MSEQKTDHVNKIYFKAGSDWYFDRYESVVIQANRWFIGFIASTTLSIILAIAIALLFPLKTLEPLIIYKNPITSEVRVEVPDKHYVPVNDHEVKSDIVRYLTLHQSYLAADINQRFKLVTQLSARDIAKQYADEQANSNKNSPVNQLGVDGIRKIKIEDIIFIDSENENNKEDERKFKVPHQNLAKVDFKTITIAKKTGGKKIESWVATIGWIYKGLPQNQEEAWNNWNGFTVTTLRIDSKNIG